MAPEQFAGSEADARSDIFAFGAILYEMATGRPAFHEKTLALLIAAVQTVDPEPVSKAQPLAPPALDYLVKRCLNKDPRQRLQTALDLTSELQWVAEGGSQVGIPAAGGGEAAKERSSGMGGSRGHVGSGRRPDAIDAVLQRQRAGAGGRALSRRELPTGTGHTHYDLARRALAGLEPRRSRRFRA